MLEKGPLLRTQQQSPDGLSRLQARRAVRDRGREAPHGAGHGEHRRVVLLQPRRARPQRRAARLPRRRRAGLRDDRGLHGPGRRRRHAALRRRLAALHARRPAPADASTPAAATCATTPTARSSARRATGPSPTTSSSRTTAEAERARRHQRHAREPGEAGVGRPLPAAAGAQPDQPLRRAGHGRAGDEALPHAAGRHHRGPRAQRPHGARRTTRRSRRLRQPLRRPARAQVQHLGVAARADRRASRTSSCAPTASSRTSRPRATASPGALPRPGGRRAHGRGEDRRRRLLGDRVGAAAEAVGAQRRGASTGAINASGLLGNYFLTHCFGGASARAARARRQVEDAGHRLGDRLLRARRLDPRATGLWAGGAIYNNTSDAALPISLARTWQARTWTTSGRATSATLDMVGDGFEDYLEENFGRRLSVSFMANQVAAARQPHRAAPDGARQVGPAGRLHHQGLALPRPGADDAILASQCGEILRRGGDGVRPRRRGLGRRPGRRGSPTTSSAAPASAPTRNDSVLDRDCRAWEFDNLYVTDGAFMPTSGGANPTLTIQANSLRVGQVLLGRL